MAYDDESEQELRLGDRNQIIKLRIEVRVLSTRLQELNDKIKDVAKDHEGRIRTLESFRWWILGACAFASFFGEVIAKVIFK